MSVACLLAQPFPVLADIDESAYMAGNAVRNDREQRRLQDQLAAEAESERRRAEAATLAEAEARAAAVARETARPYAERLTEARCTSCHEAANYEQVHHTWLGWRLVVARMVWLNDAPVAATEQAVIAGYLSGAYPARSEELAIEYGLPAGMLALLGGVSWAGRLWWKRNRKERGNDGSGNSGNAD